MKVPTSRDEQELLPINWAITLGDFTYPALKRTNKDATETSFPEQIECSRWWQSFICRILHNTGNPPVMKGEFKLNDEKSCKDDHGKGELSYKGNLDLLFCLCRMEAERQYICFLLTLNRGKLGGGGSIKIIYTEDQCWCKNKCI